MIGAKKAAVVVLGTFLFLAGAAGARAATYYVATNGSDSNSGTASNPFATIQKAANVVHAGDTIIVQDGTYGPTGGSGSIGASLTAAGTASAPITLKAANQYKAVLDCQQTCLAYLSLDSGSAYWIIQGFDITNGYDSGIYAYHGGSYSIIRGNIIEHIGYHYDSGSNGRTGVFASTYPGIVVDGNIIHDVGRPAVLTGNHDHGVYSYAPQITITNNVCYNMLNGWCVQTADGFSGTIANNTFYGPDQVLTKNGQMVLWGSDGAVTIRNNIFYNPTGYGISTAGPTFSGPCTIDHNIVYKSGGSVGMIDSLPSGCTQSNNQVNVDPKINTTLPQLTLQAGSPAIGAGAPVSGLTFDFNGATRTSWDIGAFAYAGGAATTPPPTTTPPPPTTPPPTTTPPPAGCATYGTSGWANASIPTQTGSFTLAFDATPAMAKMDGVMGASNGTASAYSSLATIVRFNNTGQIDARNGGSYAAAAAIPYSAGTSYHFRLVINLSAHTYSAYVTPAGGAEQLIASNYAFRAEQAAVSSLNNVGGLSSTGSALVCNVAASAAAAAPPPASVISGVSATNVGASGATIGWTTSTPGTSAVDYGTTASYGSTAPSGAVVAQTTSHSVTLTGLSASTVYHYRVRSIDSSGSQVASGDNTFTTSAATGGTGGTPAGCVNVPAGSWKNEALSPMTGTFTVQFSATPGMAREDAVMGLSKGPASAYTSLAAAVRFNNTGAIDARNAGAYQASASIPYSAGGLYQFRLVVNASAHTYSAYVTPPGGAEIAIGLNYKFRTEQASASTLSNLAIFDSTGGQTICNLTANGATITLN